MLSEDKVPIAERCFLLEGQVSATSLRLVRKGLPTSWPAATLCVFATYAYAELPLGKTFEFVFPEKHPERGEQTIAVIRAVTQQFGKPFDSVPQGWKTICLLDFPSGVPDIIAGLGHVDAWGVSDQQIVLCSLETAKALLQEGKRVSKSHIRQQD